MCRYNICKEIRRQRALLGYNKFGGVGMLICRNENGKLVILLGKEKHGAYSGLYNICAGKCESECVLDNAIRELEEEFKIRLTWELFDKYFKNSNGIRWFMHNGTPIFVGVFGRHDFKYTALQQQVQQDSNNYRLPDCCREMSDLVMLKTDPNLSFKQQVLDAEQNGINKKKITSIISFGKQVLVEEIDETKISSFARACMLTGFNYLQQEGCFRNHAR